MRALTTVLVLGLAACNIGPNPSTYPVSSGPHGITGTVTTNRATYSGELIVLREQSLILQSADGRLIEIPLNIVTKVQFPNAFSRTVRSVTDLQGANPNRLRLLSRFPYGLSDELLQRLLAIRNQQALIRVEG